MPAVFESEYTYDGVSITCHEDPGISLASEILSSWSPPGSEGAGAGAGGWGGPQACGLKAT